jgi:predicted RNA-binding Zn-ribbon protein involved in translation (DUF1610 family)
LVTEEKLMTAAQSAQIPCPYCGDPVAISVGAVLGARPIPCRSCGAELTVDRAKSEHALTLLEQWHADTARARSIAQADGREALEQAPGRGGKKRPRRQRTRR